MHTFPSREALTPDWGQRMAEARGHSGQGLLFTDESVVYSPGQFVSNITAAMDPAIDASETLGFLMEAMTWVTVVVQTGWLEKFPKLKAAVLESNASWLPLILSRSSNFSNLFAFQRDNRLIRDPVQVFNERCFIGFESDETLVYRLWDVFQDVAIWSSDYPHHDAEDAWEGLHHMAELNVPAEAQRELMGENARRLYGIEPVMAIKERIEKYEPAILPWWTDEKERRHDAETTAVARCARDRDRSGLGRLGGHARRSAGGERCSAHRRRRHRRCGQRAERARGRRVGDRGDDRSPDQVRADRRHRRPGPLRGARSPEGQIQGVGPRLWPRRFGEGRCRAGQAAESQRGRGADGGGGGAVLPGDLLVLDAQDPGRRSVG